MLQKFDTSRFLILFEQHNDNYSFHEINKIGLGKRTGAIISCPVYFLVHNV